MREIKFRAWDIDKQKYIYFSLYDLFLAYEPPDLNEEMIFEEYTGLKDKNGKEIYEGDIWKRDTTICVVEFKFAAWHLSYLSGPVQYPCSYSNAITGEIIGNIYENSELLEPTP